MFHDAKKRPPEGGLKKTVTAMVRSVGASKNGASSVFLDFSGSARCLKDFEQVSSAGVIFVRTGGGP